MKKLLSVLLVTGTLSLTAFAEVNPEAHTYSQETCLQNVSDMVSTALEQGTIYEKSGNPDIQPPNAYLLDDLYFLNYLDTIKLYAADEATPDQHPKVVERNSRINQTIFEAIKQGRLVGNGEEANHTNLDEHTRSLKSDCVL